MLSFMKSKTKYEYVEKFAYFTNGKKIYRVSLEEFIDKKDLQLSRDELFNKYGFYVCEYSPDSGIFEDWKSIGTYENLSDFLGEDMKEINSTELQSAIKSIKNDFQKKFDELQLDGTLYTYNVYPLYETSCFQKIAKVNRKLINKERNGDNRLFLEIDILDGKSTEIKRKFIPFVEFISEYRTGCDLEVVDSGDKYVTKIEEYFD